MTSSFDPPARDFSKQHNQPPPTPVRVSQLFVRVGLPKQPRGPYPGRAPGPGFFVPPL